MFVYGWSVLGLRFGLLVLSFYLMGSFVLRVEGDSLQMVSFRVKVWVTRIVFLSNGPFVLSVEGDSLQMVSFRAKVWVTCIVFLSDGIFRSQSRGRLSTDGQFQG